MFLTNFRLRFLAFCFLIFDFCCAYPSPYSHTSTVFPRQDSQLTLPVTITLNETITTGVGTFIQTCTITLTPTVVNGVEMVRQVKACVITSDGGTGDVSSALPPPALSSTVSTGLPSSISVSPPTLTSTSDTVSSTSTDVPSSTTGLPSGTTSLPSDTIGPPLNTDVSSSTTLPDSTITSLPPAGSVSAPPPAISGILTTIPLISGNSSVVSPPSSTGSSSVIAPTPAVPVVVIGISSVTMPTGTTLPANTVLPTGPPSSPSPSSPSPQSSGSTVPTPAPVTGSENAGTPAVVEPPGKKLQVLPIGLGVFAGVSVIALLVVGIVTWERTKHRRNFRKLRLQENGARMGYGAA